MESFKVSYLHRIDLLHAFHAWSLKLIILISICLILILPIPLDEHCSYDMYSPNCS